MKMKLVLVFLVCAIFSVTCGTDVDHSKCTLDYIRKLVMESCIKPHRYRRHTHHNAETEENNLDEDESVTTRTRHHHGQAAQFHNIDWDKLPVNSSLTIRRKEGNNRKRRVVDHPHSYYFYYCCNHMAECEEIECPI